MPNFDEISQSTAEINLLRILENGQPPYWNSVSCFDFYTCLPNFVVSDNRRRNYDVISNFQDGGHRVGKGHPGSGLVTASV